MDSWRKIHAIWYGDLPLIMLNYKHGDLRNLAVLPVIWSEYGSLYQMQDENLIEQPMTSYSYRIHTPDLAPNIL
jgi:hypothetical protein